MKKYIIFTFMLVLGSAAIYAQNIATNEESIDLGQILFRNPVTVVYNLKNSGKKLLLLSDVRMSCGCTSVQYPHEDISPDKDFKVIVTYDAKQMGHFEKLIALYSNAKESPVILRLKGIVVGSQIDFTGSYPFKIGDLKVDKNNIEFDDVNRGDRPIAQIHIFNIGTTTVQPQVMHVPPYLTAQISPSNLAAGHGGVITFILDSKQLHDLGLTQTAIYLGMYPGDNVSQDKEITISSVLLPAFDERLSAAEDARAPKLQMSNSTLALGSFGRKNKLKGTVTIANNGKEQLDIRSLQMFTDGMEVALNKSKLEPGETAHIKVTVFKSILRKARSKPRVLMITNDPAHPKVVINIDVAK